MAKKKKRPYLKTAVFGIISIASYVVLFMNVGFVMDNYTRGGVYAAFPVLTAFYFSFVHGAFASNVLDVLGIEARRRK